MGTKHKIPHCENISKVQQKNRRNKMENKYYPIIVTVPKSNKKTIERNKIDMYTQSTADFTVTTSSIPTSTRCPNDLSYHIVFSKTET